MATFTARQDLLAMIAMTRDAIVACERDGETELLEMHRSILARREAALAAMGTDDGPVFNVPTGEGEKARLTDRPAAGAPAANQFGEFQVKFASAKQTGFIKSLLERKDLTPLADSVTIDVARLKVQVAAGQVNRKAASDIITRLLGLPDLAPVASTATTQAAKVMRPASEKQVGLIGRLMAERDCGRAFGVVNETLAAVQRGDAVESRDASAAIDFLFAAPKTTPPAPATVLVAGMYRLADGTLVRVYFGRQSGQMLAKKVVKTGGKNADGTDEYEFEYMGKASRFIKADTHHLTLDEAKEWGRVTASCCVCAAHLDDPNSVKAGIGPVCATRV